MNKLQDNIIINIEIPDVEEIINSTLENMDLEALNDINIRVYDNEEFKLEIEKLKEHHKHRDRELENRKDLEELKELEELNELDNLDAIIQTEVNNKLKDLDIKIEMNMEAIEKLIKIPDSIKAKMKHMKIEINKYNENEENEKELEEQESDNE